MAVTCCVAVAGSRTAGCVSRRLCSNTGGGACQRPSVCHRVSPIRACPGVSQQVIQQTGVSRRPPRITAPSGTTPAPRRRLVHEIRDQPAAVRYWIAALMPSDTPAGRPDGRCAAPFAPPPSQSYCRCEPQLSAGRWNGRRQPLGGRQRRLRRRHVLLTSHRGGGVSDTAPPTAQMPAR